MSTQRNKADTEGHAQTVTHSPEASDAPLKRPPMEIVWRNVIFMGILHLAALYGITLLPGAKFLTWVWLIFCHFSGGLGITAGAHRLWSHKSYKAKWPMRLLLTVMTSLAAQNDVFEWARDHRVHHKFSETDADPHNAKRGFFFSHVGWLLVRKHPNVIGQGKKIDLSDLYADKICMFHRRHYRLMALLFCVVLPTLIPYYLWGETLWNAYFIGFALRYVVTLNATWCVNSVAHMWGNRPYDKNINPSENHFVVLVSGGEGFHNYHHTFPSDYSTSELGIDWNLTTAFIDLFCWLGLAYDRKTVSKAMIRQRKIRTGNLQHLRTE